MNEAIERQVAIRSRVGETLRRLFYRSDGRTVKTTRAFRRKHGWIFATTHTDGTWYAYFMPNEGDWYSTSLLEFREFQELGLVPQQVLDKYQQLESQIAAEVDKNNRAAKLEDLRKLIDEVGYDEAEKVFREAGLAEMVRLNQEMGLYE